MCDWVVGRLPSPGTWVGWPEMRRMGRWRATVTGVMKLKHGFPRVKGHVDGLTAPEPDLHCVTILSSHKYQPCNPQHVQ